MWNAQERRLKRVSEVIPGAGYWLYSHEDVCIEITGTLVSGPDFGIVDGWNLLGPMQIVSGAGELYFIDDIEQDIVLAETVWCWVDGRFVNAQDYLFGKGYWVYQPPKTATYVVRFESTWSNTAQSGEFPANPHFSSLIGATHNADVSFWSPGELSSTGIEAMAELGATGPLHTEADTAIANGDADMRLSEGGVSNVPGSLTFNLEIDRDYPLVTLVSMLAPSPDWFVGVSGLNLLENGYWVGQKEIILYAYDAGTDSGLTYTSANQDTQAREPVSRIAGEPFLVNDTIQPVAKLTFIRQ